MVNKTIKILDCTLRDGGYVNDWNFGYNNISNIIQNINASGIDFIECGFMTDKEYNPDKSLYNSLEQLHRLIPSNIAAEKTVCMIDYGEFDISKLPPANESSIFGFRIIFKKNNLDEALAACCEIQQKGYNIFINPTFINQYSEEEFLSIIKKVNMIKPFAFSIVDSMGIMQITDAKNLFHLADENLKKEITLCFHSHNNLQLSFSNTKKLIEMKSSRNIIIDSSIFGMGRGAGNIKTEFLIQYLNENYKKDYKILPILTIIHNYINKIFDEKPWGYSEPYYLSAQCFCHPNYASFLIKKHVSLDVIGKILKSIPEENKTEYDKNLIENIYMQIYEEMYC